MPIVPRAKMAGHNRTTSSIPKKVIQATIVQSTGTMTTTTTTWSGNWTKPEDEISVPQSIFFRDLLGLSTIFLAFATMPYSSFVPFAIKHSIARLIGCLL